MTDTQAARARALIPERWQHLPGGEIIVASIAAALQSEREVAAAEARRAERECFEAIIRSGISHGAMLRKLASLGTEFAKILAQTPYAGTEDSMPSTLVPAQQLSDAGEDLVRLAAAKDAEIAALTKERDRAMKVVEAARVFHKRTVKDAQVNGMICQTADLWGARWNLGTAFDALDAKAAAETAPSLPETP